MSDPKFDDTFHHARLNIAEAAFATPWRKRRQGRRQKVLEAAVEDLWSTYKVRPDLGGPETRRQLRPALKKMQKGLGQHEIGPRRIQGPRRQNAAATK